MARTRRRGEVLERAIHEAAIEELRTAGYEGMTMEAVADRARTGKAALYRRWSAKGALVLDALRAQLTDPRDLGYQRDVRTTVMAVLAAINTVLAGESGQPGVDAIAGLYRAPELRDAFVRQVVEPRLAAFAGVLREAADRGEVAPVADPRLIARTAWSLLLHGHLLGGRPLGEDELAEITDTIVMPLLHPRERAQR